MVPLRIMWSLGVLLFQYMTGSVVSLRLFNGKRMILFPGSEVSSMFLYTDIPDKEEIMVLRRLATPDTIFLDIGAHIGSYSICLMDKVKKIIAFEPFPQIAQRCRMNFIYNNVPVGNVEQIGISAINGNVRFTTDKGETENHIATSRKNTITIKSSTLDTYVKRKKMSKRNSYLIKIDVEGGEIEVVKGAMQFFRDYAIDAIVYESFGKQAVQMENLLKSIGFTIRNISEHNYYATKN